MQSQGVPFQNIGNNLRSIDGENCLEHPRLPTVHGKNTTRRSIRSLPNESIQSGSHETVFGPHRLEDENGNPIIIATTGRGTSFRDASTAVPAFWQRGKRKSMEDDQEDTENGSTASPCKRPKLGSHVFVDTYGIRGNNIADRTDVKAAAGQPNPLADIQSNPLALIPNTEVSTGCNDAVSYPITSFSPVFPSDSRAEPITGSGDSCETSPRKKAEECGSEGSAQSQAFHWVPFIDLTDDELYFNLTYGQSLEESLFLSGDCEPTTDGGLLPEEDRKYADAITAVNTTKLGPSRRRKTRAREPIPTEAVSWAQIYQPRDIQEVDTVSQVVGNTAQPSSQGEETNNPDNADCARVMESKTSGYGADHTFPYTTEIGDTIKRLIAERNSTAARRFIPDDQNIRSARGLLETTKAIKTHNLVVEKSRKPGPRNEVHWCGYRARLVHGEWQYNTMPCYRLEGCNVGFSSWDIAVRHLKEKHYEMYIPRTKKGEKNNSATRPEEMKKVGSRKGKSRESAGRDEEDLATDNEKDDDNYNHRK